jgi:hypothetical protein
MPLASTDLRPRAALVAEAIVTGLFLGLAQTALGFALLTGSGASVLLFFALTAAWIAGGALGAALVARRVSPAGEAWFLALVLVVLGVAWCVLGRWPYHSLASAVGLAAGAIAGCYAAVFLAARAQAWGDARRLLLHENNGFVAGIAAGGALLFASTHALDAAAALLGIALLGSSLAGGWRARRVTPDEEGKGTVLARRSDNRSWSSLESGLVSRTRLRSALRGGSPSK